MTVARTVGEGLSRRAAEGWRGVWDEAAPMVPSVDPTGVIDLGGAVVNDDVRPLRIRMEGDGHLGQNRTRNDEGGTDGHVSRVSQVVGLHDRFIRDPIALADRPERFSRGHAMRQHAWRSTGMLTHRQRAARG